MLNETNGVERVGLWMSLWSWNDKGYNSRNHFWPTQNCHHKRLQFTIFQSTMYDHYRTNVGRAVTLIRFQMKNGLAGKIIVILRFFMRGITKSTFHNVLRYLKKKLHQYLDGNLYVVKLVYFLCSVSFSSSWIFNVFKAQLFSNTVQTECNRMYTG